MAVTFNAGWAGLQFHHAGLDTSPYDRLRFALHSDGGPLPNVNVKLHGASGAIGTVRLSAHATPDADGWYVVAIPLSALNGGATVVTRVVLQSGSGSPQPAFYIDGLVFAG